MLSVISLHGHSRVTGWPKLLGFLLGILKHSKENIKKRNTFFFYLTERYLVEINSYSMPKVR